MCHPRLFYLINIGGGDTRFRGISTGVKEGCGRCGIEARSLEIDVAHIHTISEQGLEALLAEIIAKIFYIVGAELINDDTDHETWSRLTSLSGERQSCRHRQYRESESLHKRVI